MSDDETWRHIDEQRIELADFLETLSAEQWNTPSLCQGWTVRDVAVHVTHSAAPWPRFVVEAVRSGFRFNAMVAQAARRDTSTPAEVVATLRGMVGGRRRPPGTGVADPLMDVLVHGQDIAIPLGVNRPIATEPAVLAAQRLWTMGFPFHARKRFRGVQLVADDADFLVGAGEPVTGSMADILLALAGRRDGLARLSGPVPTAAYR